MDNASLEQWLQRLERLHPNAIDLGLERVSAVARTLQLLPVTPPVITVAGTNGKGSTVAVLEAVLLRSGRCPGVYTSPHLLRFNERIRVAGKEAQDSEIIEAFEAIEAAREQHSLTYFEFATLAALLVFRARAVDVMVLEVGLGGRLDAVNIVDPAVAVITRIDLDHQDWLGDSRDVIAVEKAGIMRRGRPVVIGDPEPPATLLSCAANVGAEPVLRLGSDYAAGPTVDGEWQGRIGGRLLPAQPRAALLPVNICTALQAAALAGCSLPDEELVAAVAEARPTGRCERQDIAGRGYVLDVAHNPAAVYNLLDYISVTNCKGKVFALFSAMADKDIPAMIKAAGNGFDAWFVADQPGNARAAPAAEHAAALHDAGQLMVSSSKNLRQAFRRAHSMMARGDVLVVFGSFYTVAAILPLLARERGSQGETA
jgi:dihydrofolate synthase/folylpolyglutamate synthase